MRWTSFFGCAAGGDEVKPAPGHVGVGGEGEDAAGQDVEAAKVVQQPAVQPLIAEGGLDRSEIKHGRWALGVAGVGDFLAEGRESRP